MAGYRSGLRGMANPKRPPKRVLSPSEQVTEMYESGAPDDDIWKLILSNYPDGYTPARSRVIKQWGWDPGSRADWTADLNMLDPALLENYAERASRGGFNEQTGEYVAPVTSDFPNRADEVAWSLGREMNAAHWTPDRDRRAQRIIDSFGNIQTAGMNVPEFIDRYSRVVKGLPPVVQEYHKGVAWSLVSHMQELRTERMAKAMGIDMETAPADELRRAYASAWDGRKIGKEEWDKGDRANMLEQLAWAYNDAQDFLRTHAMAGMLSLFAPIAHRPWIELAKTADSMQFGPRYTDFTLEDVVQRKIDDGSWSNHTAPINAMLDHYPVLDAGGFWGSLAAGFAGSAVAAPASLTVRAGETAVQASLPFLGMTKAGAVGHVFLSSMVDNGLWHFFAGGDNKLSDALRDTWWETAFWFGIHGARALGNPKALYDRLAKPFDVADNIANQMNWGSTGAVDVATGRVNDTFYRQKEKATLPVAKTSDLAMRYLADEGLWIEIRGDLPDTPVETYAKKSGFASPMTDGARRTAHVLRRSYARQAFTRGLREEFNTFGKAFNRGILQFLGGFELDPYVPGKAFGKEPLTYDVMGMSKGGVPVGIGVYPNVFRHARWAYAQSMGVGKELAFIDLHRLQEPLAVLSASDRYDVTQLAGNFLGVRRLMDDVRNNRRAPSSVDQAVTIKDGMPHPVELKYQDLADYEMWLNECVNHMAGADEANMHALQRTLDAAVSTNWGHPNDTNAGRAAFRETIRELGKMVHDLWDINPQLAFERGPDGGMIVRERPTDEQIAQYTNGLTQLMELLALGEAHARRTPIHRQLENMGLEKAAEFTSGEGIPDWDKLTHEVAQYAVADMLLQMEGGPQDPQVALDAANGVFAYIDRVPGGGLVLPQAWRDIRVALAPFISKWLVQNRIPRSVPTDTVAMFDKMFGVDPGTAFTRFVRNIIDQYDRYAQLGLQAGFWDATTLRENPNYVFMKAVDYSSMRDMETEIARRYAPGQPGEARFPKAEFEKMRRGGYNYNPNILPALYEYSQVFYRTLLATGVEREVMRHFNLAGDAIPGLMAMQSRAEIGDATKTRPVRFIATEQGKALMALGDHGEIIGEPGLNTPIRTFMDVPASDATRLMDMGSRAFWRKTKGGKWRVVPFSMMSGDVESVPIKKNHVRVAVSVRPEQLDVVREKGTSLAQDYKAVTGKKPHDDLEAYYEWQRQFLLQSLSANEIAPGVVGSADLNFRKRQGARDQFVAIAHNLSPVHSWRPRVQYMIDLHNRVMESQRAVAPWHINLPGLHWYWPAGAYRMFAGKNTMDSLMGEMLEMSMAGSEIARGQPEVWANVLSGIQTSTFEGLRAEMDKLSAKNLPLPSLVPDWVARGMYDIQREYFRFPIKLELGGALPWISKVWKTKTLFFLHNHVHYLWNNVTTDIQRWLTAGPGAVRALGESARMCYQYLQNGVTTPLMMDIISEGGHQGYWGKHETFEADTAPAFMRLSGLLEALADEPFVEPTRATSILKSVRDLGKGMLYEEAMRTNELREMMMTIAAYLDVTRVHNETGKWPIGSSDPRRLAGLSDFQVGMKLARERKGDYSNLSRSAEDVRSGIALFASWADVNGHMTINNMRHLTYLSELTTDTRLKSLLRSVALIGVPLLARAYNKYRAPQVYGEDLEAQSPTYYQEMTNLLFGRDRDEKILYLPLRGPMDDTWQFFGLDGVFNYLDQVGMPAPMGTVEWDDWWAHTAQYMKDAGYGAKPAFNYIFGQISPFLTDLTLTPLTNQVYFPDATHPRKSWDTKRDLFVMIEARAIYDFLFKRPNKYGEGMAGFREWMKDEFVPWRAVDADSVAYYDVRDFVRNWMSEKFLTPTITSDQLKQMEPLSLFQRALVYQQYGYADFYAKLLSDDVRLRDILNKRMKEAMSMDPALLQVPEHITTEQRNAMWSSDPLRNQFLIDMGVPAGVVDVPIDAGNGQIARARVPDVRMLIAAELQKDPALRGKLSAAMVGWLRFHNVGRSYQQYLSYLATEKGRRLTSPLERAQPPATINR